MTHSRTTFRIMTLGIIVRICDARHIGNNCLCRVVLLSVTIKSFILCVIMLNVVMLRVNIFRVMLSVVMLRGIELCVTILSVIIVTLS
jgi:hypothetical protein